MIDLDTPNDYSIYQGEVDTAWLRQRIDHAMDNVSDVVMKPQQLAELCYAMEERQALRDMLDDSRRTLALIAEVTGMPKEPHQGFKYRLMGHAKALAERAAQLNAKLHDINDSLRGHGFEVANHHLNGELEPLDTWFEDNDWEPIELGMPEIVACPNCLMAQFKNRGNCETCGTVISDNDASQVNLNSRERAVALQWVFDNAVSAAELPPMIERLTAIADGKRQPCSLLGMMCRGCPDCQGIKGWE